MRELLGSVFPPYTAVWGAFMGTEKWARFTVRGKRHTVSGWSKSRGHGNFSRTGAVASRDSLVPYKVSDTRVTSWGWRDTTGFVLSTESLHASGEGILFNFSLEPYTLWSALCHTLSLLSKTRWRKLGSILVWEHLFGSWHCDFKSKKRNSASPTSVLGKHLSSSASSRLKVWA